MASVIINKDKCIGCGQCVGDCVGGHLFVENGKVSAQKVGCIGCGHCYAICPTEAIHVDGLVPGDGELHSFTEFDSSALLQAMKSRRTVRQFTSQPIEDEKIDMILEAGRYCPTAANSQDVAYTILGSRQKEIEGICVGMFSKLIGAAGKVSSFMKNMNIGENFFFKGAPLVIVVSGKGSGNANLASSYMEIMAESLGLGVLYSGFFVSCAKLNPKIGRLLELPRGHKVVTCMVIGYPAVKYRRIPGRKALSVKKL